MTTAGGDDVDQSDDASRPDGPRWQIEPGARGAFWHMAFPALVVVLALAVPAVAWFGRESLLDSRGGKVEQPVLDPSAPGYEAVVEPTPTMLLVHVSDDDTLVGVTFLAQAGDDAGSVLFIPVNTSVEVEGLGLPDPATVTSVTGAPTTAAPPSTVPPPASADATTAPPVDPSTTQAPATTSAPDTDVATGAFPLKDIYQLGGVPAVTHAVEKILGVGIGGRTAEIDGEIIEDPDAENVVELGASRWGELVEPVAPLRVDNQDLVSVEDEAGNVVAQFPGGEIDLPPEGVGAFLEARNADESELNRIARHQAFWTAWLTVVSASTDEGVIPGEREVGLGAFVRSLARSQVAFFTLPVDTVRVPGTGDDLFLVDQEATADLMVSLVPFPVGSDVSPRPRVRVLDGTGQEGLVLDAAEALVRAGAEIEIMGNAASFDHVTNDVVYYDAAMAETAQAYADALGGGSIGMVEEPGEVVDLTVVVGTDFAADDGSEATGG